MVKKKYYMYDVPFYIENSIGKSMLVSGVTIASSQTDAKRRIKTAYKVVKFGKVKRQGNMEFNKPNTRGIA